MSRAAQLRPAVLLCACLAPLGWAAFWAVFHTVPGQDWVVFHTAAARLFAGDVAMLSDPLAFTVALNRTHAAWFAQPLLFHPWVYPPVTLLLAAAFGWLPYLASLYGFLAVSCLALLAALWGWESRGRRAWLVCGVLACPASAFTIGSGQLSFMVAACVVAGLGWLRARPVCAGLVLSLLCMKPQFALLVPVALLAGRHWRAAASACLGGAMLVAASVAVAGLGAWTAWLHLATGGDPQLGPLIQAVRVYDQSVHRCLEILGAGVTMAGTGQLLAIGIAAVCVGVVFHSRAAPRRQLIVLSCAMVFGAPHVGDYDDVLLALAATLCLLDARLTWLAAGLWLSPMLNPPGLVAVLNVRVLTCLSALTPLLALFVMLAMTRADTRRNAAGSLPAGSSSHA